MISERTLASAYAALAIAIAIVATALSAWWTIGFHATDLRWWKWLLDYWQVAHELPPPLLAILTTFIVVAGIALALNPFSFRCVEYGSAAFASRSMLRRMGLTARTGIVVGRLGRRVLAYDRPLSTLVLAPPGAGKTAGIAIPTLLYFRGSVIANDPKGEMYLHTASWRARQGKLYRIEWNNPASTRWNPLSPRSLPTEPSELEIAIDRLVAIFIQSEKGRGEDFWVKSARSALSAIALFHIYEARRTSREASFAAILSWMAVALVVPASDDSDPIATHYRQAANIADNEKYPRRVVDELNSLANQNFKTRADVLKTIEAGLRVFRNSAVAEATSRSDFDLRELRAGQLPISIYVVVPPANADVFGPITGALIELAGQMAVSVRGHPALFLLDEVPEMPALNIVTRGPAIGRGQDVRFVIIAQDNGQLIERYGRTGFDTIMTTTAYKVVLTQNHPETQAMISRMIGNTTRRRYTKSRPAGAWFKGSTSESLEGAPLVRPEDLGSMRQGRQLVIVQEFMRHPVECRTAFYFNLAEFRRRAASAIATSRQVAHSGSALTR